MYNGNFTIFILIILGTFVCESKTKELLLKPQLVDSPNIQVLSKPHGVILGWQLSNKNPNTKVVKDRDVNGIEFQIEGRTEGYLALGISPSGTMEGADILIGQIRGDEHLDFGDYHATNNSRPKKDTKPDSDWVLDQYKRKDGFIYFKVWKPLNATDDEDCSITALNTRILWAVGSYNKSEDLLVKHKTLDRGSVEIDLLRARVSKKKNEKTEEIIFKSNLTLSKNRTTYWCTFHKFPEFTGERHITAFGAHLPTSASIAYTHHFILYKCLFHHDTPREYMEKYFSNGDHCYGYSIAHNIRMGECTEYLFVWGTGGQNMTLPNHVGYNIEPGSFLVLEVHYNNPDGKEIPVESGVVISYTSDIREYDAGILTVGYELGAELQESLIVPPNVDNITIAGHCSSSCTDEKLVGGPINVFNVLMHAHEAGKKLKLRHYRDSEELPNIMRNDKFVFDFQKNQDLLPEVQVHAGDHMTFECTYSSMLRNGSVVTGGLATYQEMCYAFLWYYPRLENFEICSSKNDFNASLSYFGVKPLWDKGPLPRPHRANILDPLTVQITKDVKSTKPNCQKGENVTYTEYLENCIHWTPAKIEEYSFKQQYSRQQAFCGIRHYFEPKNFTGYPDGVLTRSVYSWTEYIWTILTSW